jgi:UDP-glucose 4-epimerase
VPPWGDSKVRKITPSFVCRALENQDIEVYGDGSQISDMVWVGDVAHALVVALEKANEDIVFPEVVEVGPKQSSTVQEVAGLIIDLTGSQSKIVNLPMRPGETENSIVSANTDSLKHVDMTEESLTQLIPGMQQTIEHFKQLLNK